MSRVTQFFLQALALVLVPSTTWTYTVPSDAVPLVAQPPRFPSPVAPPLPPEPARSISTRERALAGLEFSPSEYFVLGGQSVYTPRPLGWVSLRSVSGAGCPLPRFTAPGVVAFGWSASGSPPKEFEDCGDRVRSLSFFIAPKGHRSRGLEGVSPEQYAAWKLSISDAEARNLGNLVTSAASRALGAETYGLVEVSSSATGGMPGILGKMDIVSRRGVRRTMEFSAVVTAAGRGENSVWTVCVAAAELDRALASVESSSSAIARAFFYLNRDYNAETYVPGSTSGPFSPRKLR